MSLTRDLIYRFSARGQADVIKTIRTIREEAAKQAKEEIAGAEAVLRAKRNARGRALSDEQRYQRDAFRLMLASRNREVAEARKAEQQKTKATEREAKARQKEADRAAKNEEKRFAASLRHLERIEREKTKVLEREARRRERLEESNQRRVENRARHAQRQAERDAETHARKMARIAERERRDLMFDTKRFYRGVGTGFVEGGRAAFNLVGGVVRTGVRGISQGLGLNNAFDVSGIVAENAHGQALMRAAAIEARTAGGSFSFDERGAMAKVRKTALGTGLSQADLFKAINVYSEKGSAQTAVDNIHRIARQAKAMDTDASVIAKLRAQMGISSAVTGKELSEDEKDQLIAKMHFIGKTGVFRAEDIAKESESLFSQFAKSGMDFRSGFNRYISFANEARKATGSGAMARTAINSVQDAIAKKEGDLKNLGVNTRNKDGSQRDFIDVVMEAINKTGGEGKAFTKIFDPSRSGKAISTLISANRAAGGGASGSEAMRRLLAGDASIQNATVAEMNKDADHAINSGGNKIKMAVERVRQSLLETLLPALEKLAKHLPTIVSHFTSAVEFVNKHPVLTTMALGSGLAVAGAAKGASMHWAGSLARFTGDRLAQSRLGAASRVAGKFGGALGAIGGVMQSAGATPVYVTGVAPGVGGFGGGGVDLPGGAKTSLPGAPAAAGAATTAAPGAPAAAGAVSRVASTIGKVAPKLGIGATALMALFMGDYEKEGHEKEAAARARKTNKKRQNELAKKFAAGKLTDAEAQELVRGTHMDASGNYQNKREFSDDEEQRRIKKLRYGDDAGEVSGAGGRAGDVIRNTIFNADDVVDPDSLYGGANRPKRKPKNQIGFDMTPQSGFDARDALKGMFGYEVKPKESVADVSSGDGGHAFVKDMVPDLSSAKAIEKAATSADKLAVALESLGRAVQRIDANVNQLRNVPR